MHGKCVLENARTGPVSVWRVREGNSLVELSGESVKVISWLSEKEGLRESSGESVKVIGWLSERRGRLANP